MPITIDFAPNEAQLLERQAVLGNTSIQEYVKRSALKAAQNAEYLAMLERSREELRTGKVVVKSMAELEAMAEE